MKNHFYELDFCNTNIAPFLIFYKHSMMFWNVLQPITKMLQIESNGV